MSNLDEKIVRLMAEAYYSASSYAGRIGWAESGTTAMITAIDALRAAGFEIVPREPTEAMLAAGFDNRMTFSTIWTAMIQASRHE